MRIWPRLTTFASLTLTIFWSAASPAQMMGYPSNAPAFMGGSPAYSAVDTSGYPPSAASHPMISPFENSFEQHYQDQNGLWMRDARNWTGNGNTYSFSLEYAYTRTRGLSGRIGNNLAPTFTQQETIDGTNANLPDAALLNNFNPGDMNEIAGMKSNGIMFNFGIHRPTGWGFDTFGGWVTPQVRTFDARGQFNANRFFSNADAQFFEADGTTIGYDPFTDQQERDLVINEILTGDITIGLGTDFGRLGDQDDLLDRQLMNLRALPLQRGIPDPQLPGGFNQRFDLDYITKHTVESYHFGGQFYGQPIYETDRITISPVLGGRYSHLNEGFQLHGADSGLDYDANIPDGLDDDDDGVVDNVAETGTDTFTAQNPYGTTLNGDGDAASLVLTDVVSTVKSHLAGPELGVKYQIGSGEGISITGSTKVGALMNTERIQLSGDNVGDTVTLDTNDATLLRDMFHTARTASTPTTQNAFSDGKTSTHVSPMFQQSFHVLT